MTGPPAPRLPPVPDAGGRVLGAGLDLVHVPGLADQLAVAGSVFAQRAFTPRERREAARRARQCGSRPAEHLAARWAAKEAFVKAWSAALHGSPPVMGHVAWHEIEIVSDPWHRPGIALHGEAARAFAESVGRARIHVSLSHDGPMAAAQAIVEAA